MPEVYVLNTAGRDPSSVGSFLFFLDEKQVSRELATPTRLTAPPIPAV